MHKILMEESYKPSTQPQCRLNSLLWETIRKEVLKLLDESIIYLIFDSAWVSPAPMQKVVPKKRGIMVVKNDNNELILTRTTAK